MKTHIIPVLALGILFIMGCSTTSEINFAQKNIFQHVDASQCRLVVSGHTIDLPPNYNMEYWAFYPDRIERIGRIGEQIALGKPYEIVGTIRYDNLDALKIVPNHPISGSRLDFAEDRLELSLMRTKKPILITFTKVFWLDESGEWSGIHMTEDKGLLRRKVSDLTKSIKL